MALAITSYPTTLVRGTTGISITLTDAGTNLGAITLRIGRNSTTFGNQWQTLPLLSVSGNVYTFDFPRAATVSNRLNYFQFQLTVGGTTVNSSQNVTVDTPAGWEWQNIGEIVESPGNLTEGVPDLAVLDQVICEETTTPDGYPFSVDPSGWPSIDWGDDTPSQQSVSFYIISGDDQAVSAISTWTLSPSVSQIPVGNGAIHIPGRAAPETRYQSSSFSLESVTQAASFMAFRVVSNPDNTLLSGSPALMRMGASSSGPTVGLADSNGMRVSFGWRTNGGNTNNNHSNFITVGETVIICQKLLIDPTNGNLKKWRNSSLFADVDLGTATYHGTTGVVSSVAGAILANRDIEFLGMAYWKDTVPSDAELASIVEGEDFEAQINAMSAQPWKGWIPNGTDGEWVSEIAPTWGDTALPLLQGAEEADADRAYFVVEEPANPVFRPAHALTYFNSEGQLTPLANVGGIPWVAFSAEDGGVLSGTRLDSGTFATDSNGNFPDIDSDAFVGVGDEIQIAIFPPGGSLVISGTLIDGRT